MVQDLEVGVMLEVDESQLEDVEDQEVNVNGGGGGDMSPAEKDQQESVVAGGVSKGLLAAGVIAGILSQLKSITGIVNAVLGAISRALVPIIEEVADIIRPFIETASSLAAAPGRAPEIVGGAIGGNTTEDLNRLGKVFGSSGLSTGERLDTLIKRPEGISDQLIEFLGGTTIGKPDQSGEANKQQLKDNLEESARDKTGAFNP